MPGPVSATATSTSLSPRADVTSTRPPVGVNLTAFDRRLKTTCRMRRSSPSISWISGSDTTDNWTPLLDARSRNITTPRSSASRSENGAKFSSICPASTFERSRTSSISESR